MYQTHQYVMLSHAGPGVLGPDLAPDDVAELRCRLRAACSSPPVEGPVRSSPSYGSFVLADSFDDDRLSSLGDVPDFSSPRPHGEVYKVADGLLALPDGSYRAAVDLEPWLLTAYTRYGFRQQLEMMEAPLRRL